MFLLVSSLFVLPVVVSGLVLIIPKMVSRILVITTAFILTATSLYLFVSFDHPYAFRFPRFTDEIIMGADLLLLLYFAGIAIRKRNILVGLMTVLQLGVSLFLLKDSGAHTKMPFLVDKLSLFMFLLINVISSVISVFSLKYIEGEACTPLRKKYFLSILFWFIAAMNLVVCSDNLDYFFLFFELTTLASYLLISFRKDEQSVQNALTALWMNQVGGLAILAAIVFIRYHHFGEASFSNLLGHAASPLILLPLALLSIAALIKGAQMPFSKWLLGAMVAPTPVSALLHSSTMVKIAPYMILRLSPALKDTPVAWVIIALTGFVFAASAVGALSQDNFKRILAHSTIALLALMIMMAAVGTPVTLIASLILILFHGLSKCMLFLNAGVMERVFHVKEASDMDRMGDMGPFTSFVVAVGFMSLLLPPFGAFIGKWFSIETLGAFALDQKIIGAVVIVLIAFGGAVLSLLYFKVLGVLLTRSGQLDKPIFEKLSPFFSVTLYILLGLVTAGILSFPLLLTGFFLPVASQTLQVPIAHVMEGWTMHVGSMALPIVPLMVAFLLLPATLLLAMLVRLKHVDRVKEYACGEKVNYSFSTFYFSTDRASPYFTAVGILFFLALIAVVLM